MNIARAKILVAGGGGDIGFFLARDLHSRGAAVCIADRNLDRLQNAGLDIPGFTVDATDPDSVLNMIAAVMDTIGGLDVLVNCTGAIYSEPLLNLTNPRDMRHSHAAFTRILEANLHTAFVLGSVVAERMARTRTRGLILNFSSISARGNAGQTAYAAAKAGLEAMTRVWAKELGPLAIRAVALAPGFIDTPSTHQALTPSIIKHVQANTPLRRLGRQDEVASAVRSIIENDFITGMVLDVDGGLTF
ncbi:3-oxoacyl-[acyl-carrier protein] reductase [Desulfonatronum zhilinae]|nr:3-oxoacyl-[acyl-carrier protein] reductase [Desulfonatronum zhilinae]